MFPFSSELSCQTELFRHGVQFVTMKGVGQFNWSKCIVKIKYDKILKNFTD
jgi:hypothetical protein